MGDGGGQEEGSEVSKTREYKSPNKQMVMPNNPKVVIPGLHPVIFLFFQLIVT